MLMEERKKAIQGLFVEKELVIIREALDMLATYHKQQANIPGNVSISKDYRPGQLKKLEEVRTLYETFNL